MSRWTFSAALAAIVAFTGSLGAAAQDARPGASGTATAAPAKSDPERWAGSIYLPGNMKLDFTLGVERTQDGMVARLSIPAQKLDKAALRDVKRDGDAIEFTLGEPNPPQAWAKFVVTVAPDGTASGSMTQAGQTFPVKMERIGAGEPDRAGFKGGAAPAAAADLPGDRWEGGVDLPGGVNLGMNVRLVAAKGSVPASGTMSIPMQGLADGALHDVVIEKDRLAFVLRPSGAEQTWAKFDLKVSADGKDAEGTMVQMGQTFPAKFRKLVAGEATKGMNRPQEPKPPFPYESRDVSFPNQKAGITLAGTLTTPRGPGPYPCAVMITGSGPQDRDETLLGHKPFLVIADHLTRNGIAVLRYDDRGVAGSKGDFSAATSEDFAEDVRSAIAFLKTQSDIKPGVGLIGHSEGGLITSKVAGDVAAGGGEKAGIAWVVMLAGTGVSGTDIMVYQASQMAATDGADAAKVKQAESIARAAADLIVKDAPADEIRAIVRKLVDAQVEMQGEVAKKEMDEAGGPDTMTDQALQTLCSPWFRYFLKYDPREDLARIKVPVLALNGSLDVQVRADENLPEIEKALKAGGNTDFTIKKLDGLNHLFQTATTGRFQEYAVIEETVSPKALDAMTAWIRKHAGLEK